MAPEGADSFHTATPAGPLAEVKSMSIFQDNGHGLCVTCGQPSREHYQSDGRCMSVADALYVTAQFEGHTVYFRADAGFTGLTWTADRNRAYRFLSKERAEGYATDLRAVIGESYSDVQVTHDEGMGGDAILDRNVP